jgi:hypothetical protein
MQSARLAHRDAESADDDSRASIAIRPSWNRLSVSLCSVEDDQAISKSQLSADFLGSAVGDTCIENSRNDFAK